VKLMPTNIGVVFDFDDTLAPDSTTHLLQEYDIDPDEFWNDQFRKRVQNGYDPTVAYLTLLLDYVGEDDPLGESTPEKLEQCAESLENELYDGVPEIFEDLDDIVNEYDDVSIEYYVVSEGIESLISGSIITEYCTEIYASRLATDENNVLNRVKRPISFTDKTRYLYEINKGITSSEAKENPYKVNEEIAEQNRHIPFENIIYIGDGITDIPCFSLVKDRSGRVFGVMETDEKSAKQEAILDIGSPQRAGNLNPPDYRPDGRLGSLLRLTIEGLCTDSTIDRLEAL
jgi:2-hydroxy-3-keto-5-methylthiopentenyl-1-phosphate phosphatase